MKLIQLECKTAGFNFGDKVEVGSGKGQIKLEAAKDLVAEGFAKEIIVAATKASKGK